MDVKIRRGADGLSDLGFGSDDGLGGHNGVDDVDAQGGTDVEVPFGT